MEHSTLGHNIEENAKFDEVIISSEIFIKT